MGPKKKKKGGKKKKAKTGEEGEEEKKDETGDQYHNLPTYGWMKLEVIFDFSYLASIILKSEFEIHNA